MSIRYRLDIDAIMFSNMDQETVKQKVRILLELGFVGFNVSIVRDP